MANVTSVLEEYERSRTGALRCHHAAAAPTDSCWLTQTNSGSKQSTSYSHGRCLQQQLRSSSYVDDPMIAHERAHSYALAVPIERELTEDELDLLAVFFTLVKILYTCGTLSPLPRLVEAIGTSLTRSP